MTKRVTVEELREHLDDHLAEVKRGERLTIVDDKQPIATMAPAVAAAHEAIRYPFRNLDFGPPLELATIRRNSSSRSASTNAPPKSTA